MSEKLAVEVTLIGSRDIRVEATISLHNNLIMLHAPFISAQWAMEGTGVELTHQGQGRMKLGFHTNGINYQSFIFDAAQHTEVDKFFKLLGFPMHKPINDEEIKNWKSKDA